MTTITITTKNTFTRAWGIDVTIEEEDFPALYNSADSASLKAQSAYFNALKCYLRLAEKQRVGFTG